MRLSNEDIEKNVTILIAAWVQSLHPKVPTKMERELIEAGRLIIQNMLINLNDIASNKIKEI